MDEPSTIGIGLNKRQQRAVCNCVVDARALVYIAVVLGLVKAGKATLQRRRRRRKSKQGRDVFFSSLHQLLRCVVRVSKERGVPSVVFTGLCGV